MMLPEPAAASPDRPSSTRARFTLVLVCAVAVLAWLYLVWMDWGMRNMSQAVDMLLMPSMNAWQLGDLLLVFLMWAVMMAAMMLPSALPAILLMARIDERISARARRDFPLWAFVCGYLLVWLAFSIAATLLQWALLEATLISPMWASVSPRLSAAILIGAGLYQFTPVKRACLSRCRSPLSLLVGLRRDGATGALRTGARHGMDCLGCCLALMCLLFVTGVMSLIWVAAIAAYALAEKLLPRWWWISRAAGALLVVWGGLVLATVAS